MDAEIDKEIAKSKGKLVEASMYEKREESDFTPTSENNTGGFDSMGHKRFKVKAKVQDLD